MTVPDRSEDVTAGNDPGMSTSDGDLIQPNETAYRLELTPSQLKITHTALKSLYDDLGHEETDVKRIVAEVLAKLPGEHDVRAIDLDRERRRGLGA
jgi:hypothetical protein